MFVGYSSTFSLSHEQYHTGEIPYLPSPNTITCVLHSRPPTLIYQPEVAQQ